MSKSTVTAVDSMTCAECGMLVEPSGAFHPWLYCWLFARGVSHPAEFLARNGFVPDPKVWGDATLKQTRALAAGLERRGRADWIGVDHEQV